MARTIEQVLRDYLGDQVLMLARMTADLEKLREQVEIETAANTHVLKDDTIPVPPQVSRPNGHG